MKKMGLILPNNLWGRFLYLMLHEIATFFVVTQYVELYIIRSNLDLVLTNLKISMLSIVCIAKSNTCVFWQVHWKNLIDYLTEADGFERNSDNSNIKIILDKYTKYCRRMTYNYWVLVFTTVLLTCCTPLIQIYSSSVYRDRLRNGTELFPHIFSSWVPIDKYHSPGLWMTVVWHCMICFYGGLIMAAYDTTVIVAMVFFGGKLDILRERCKVMLGTSDNPVNDDEANIRTRELHLVHVLLLKYSRLFNSMLSPVMFLYIILCSLMLCASAYQLTLPVNAAQKLLMAEYLVFGVAQIFVFCWHSNDVLDKYEKMMLGPYESTWWESSLQQRKNILLLAGQFRIIKVFTAGPFTNLTLATFITILKGSYSYYTLLRK
uniref:Odorant receptor n=1 Tax=Leucinodes orbonalis TaxID=711050 RepID=A0AAU0QMN3_9NEOP|nr:odorant receptor [Leucinodes orbonalis]